LTSDRRGDLQIELTIAYLPEVVGDVCRDAAPWDNFACFSDRGV
jgi:hypothetical protein